MQCNESNRICGKMNARGRKINRNCRGANISTRIPVQSQFKTSIKWRGQRKQTLPGGGSGFHGNSLLSRRVCGWWLPAGGYTGETDENQGRE